MPDHPRCPTCSWANDYHPRWTCRGCGTSMDIFRSTDGAGHAKCPVCAMKWERTACPACDAVTPHEEWIPRAARRAEKVSAVVFFVAFMATGYGLSMAVAPFLRTRYDGEVVVAFTLSVAVGLGLLIKLLVRYAFIRSAPDDDDLKGGAMFFSAGLVGLLGLVWNLWVAFALWAVVLLGVGFSLEEYFRNRAAVAP